MSYFRTALMAIVLAVSAANATDTVQIQIDQNTASASIQPTAGVSVDFSLTFEQVSGLTAQNLGLSAGVVNPTNAALVARLPQGTSIPAGLPVLIAVEPPSTGSLSFLGIVAISLHTTNLSWTPGTPLRLLAAPLGGKFVDITASTAAGSYRAGANKPGFSEFLVVADLRPIDTVIAEKLDGLQSKLTQYSASIPAVLEASLQAARHRALGLRRERSTWRRRCDRRIHGHGAATQRSGDPGCLARRTRRRQRRGRAALRGRHFEL